MLPACEDAHHMWIVTQQSYIIRPFTSQAHQLTHRHAPQRQMGIPGLERLCLPHQERADQKLQPVFYEVRVIKLLADLVYLKTTGPCGPSSSRGPPPPVTQGVGAEGFAGVVVVWRGGRKGKERSIFGIATLRYHLLLLEKQSYTYAEYIEKGDIMKSAKS